MYLFTSILEGIQIPLFSSSLLAPPSFRTSWHCHCLHCHCPCDIAYINNPMGYINFSLTAELCRHPVPNQAGIHSVSVVVYLSVERCKCWIHILQELCIWYCPIVDLCHPNFCPRPYIPLLIQNLLCVSVCSKVGRWWGGLIAQMGKYYLHKFQSITSKILHLMVSDSWPIPPPFTDQAVIHSDNPEERIWLK